MVNFTEKQTAAKLQVEPILQHWNINPSTNKSELSFIKTPATIDLSANAPEPAKSVESAGAFGGNMESVTAVMGVIGTVSMVLSIISAGAPSGPIVQMIRLFKVFFR
jgi:hypothetical protein